MIWIRGGRLIDPGQGLDQIMDIYIQAGKIIGLDQAPKGFKPTQIIEADGQIVCPGLIDLGVYIREPGQEFKATICSESRAAASSGITSLIVMPDTYPRIDTPAVWELIRRRADHCGMVRIFALGALSQNLAGEQLSPIGELKKSGCVGLSNGRYPFKNNLILRRALQYASTFDLPVILCSEDADLKGQGCVHEGAVSTRLGLPGIPSAAEIVAVARDLALAEDTGCRVHFHTLSSAGSLRLLQNAPIKTSASVAAHQLFLTEQDVDGFNALCRLEPPLRQIEDRNALRQALSQGLINILCSDHQPHEADAKMNPFCLTEPGISSLETLLPLSLKLVDEGVLSLYQAIACLTYHPAQLLDLPLGRLKIGDPADICIFDPNQIWQFQTEHMNSAGKHSPFDGWEFKARVKHTLVAGRVVYTDE